MPSNYPKLTGLRVLLVEDTALVAAEIERLLKLWGCEPLGPYTHLETALMAARARTGINGALLDVNLQGEAVYPLAHELLERGIPFIFVTGYGRQNIPQEFEQTPVLEKPFGARDLGELMTRTFGAMAHQ